MKGVLILIAVILSIWCSAQTEKNNRQNFLFDNEKDFTTSQADSFQKLLKDHYRKTGDEIVLVTTDSLGEDVLLYAEHFGANHGMGDGNKTCSMVIAFSKKEGQLGMVPNKKLQTIIPQQMLDQGKISGMPVLQPHQYFEGIWKLCKALVDFLEDPAKRKE